MDTDFRFQMVYYWLEFSELTDEVGVSQVVSHAGEEHVMSSVHSSWVMTELGHNTGPHEEPLLGETIVCMNMIPKIMDPMTNTSALPSDFSFGWFSTSIKVL